MTRIDKNAVEQAEHQFIGFAIGVNSGNIEELISSMGLEYFEWEYIKRKKMVDLLTKEQKKEVNSYFEDKIENGEEKNV